MRQAFPSTRRASCCQQPRGARDLAAVAETIPVDPRPVRPAKVLDPCQPSRARLPNRQREARKTHPRRRARAHLIGAIFTPVVRTPRRVLKQSLRSSVGDDAAEQIEEPVRHLRCIPHAGTRYHVAPSLTSALRLGSPHSDPSSEQMPADFDATGFLSSATGAQLKFWVRSKPPELLLHSMLNAQVQLCSAFGRKHYFYSDLPTVPPHQTAQPHGGCNASLPCTHVCGVFTHVSGSTVGKKVVTRTCRAMTTEWGSPRYGWNRFAARLDTFRTDSHLA